MIVFFLFVSSILVVFIFSFFCCCCCCCCMYYAHWPLQHALDVIPWRLLRFGILHTAQQRKKNHFFFWQDWMKSGGRNVTFESNSISFIQISRPFFFYYLKEKKSKNSIISNSLTLSVTHRYMCNWTILFEFLLSHVSRGSIVPHSSFSLFDKYLIEDRHTHTTFPQQNIPFCFNYETKQNFTFLKMGDGYEIDEWGWLLSHSIMAPLNVIERKFFNSLKKPGCCCLFSILKFGFILFDIWAKLSIDRLPN